MNHLNQIAFTIRESNRLAFIKSGLQTIPPIAFCIAENLSVTIVPAFSNRTREEFWAYLKQRNFTEPTAAVVFIAHAIFKLRSKLKGDAEITTSEDQVIKEALVSVLELPDGKQQSWYAKIVRDINAVEIWKEPTKSHFMSMFGRNN